MQIRKFIPGEELALWELFHNTVRHVNHDDYTEEQLAAWAPDQIDLPRWRARLRGISPFVVVHQDKLIAYADVQATGYVDHFFVHHQWQRRRVGSLLMHVIHEVAKQNEVEKLFADVSVAARPFFESWGFVLEKEQWVRVHQVDLKNFRMTKPLSS
jgi:putative acetyltransferase